MFLLWNDRQEDAEHRHDPRRHQDSKSRSHCVALSEREAGGYVAWAAAGPEGVGVLNPRDAEAASSEKVAHDAAPPKEGADAGVAAVALGPHAAQLGKGEEELQDSEDEAGDETALGGQQARAAVVEAGLEVLPRIEGVAYITAGLFEAPEGDTGAAAGCILGFGAHHGERRGDDGEGEGESA